MSRPPAHQAPDEHGAGTWDLAFIRWGTLVTVGMTACAVPVLALTSGWAGVTSVLAGAVVVTAFFAASGFAVAWAGRHLGDNATLPAALLMFGVKMMVLLGVLQNLPADGWIDRVLLGWAVFVGVLLWTGVQMRWVWTRQLYYSPPPAPPGGRP